MAGTIDANKSHTASDDFKETGGFVAEPEQRLAGFQFAVDRGSAHRGGEPILSQHRSSHPNLLNARRTTGWLE